MKIWSLILGPVLAEKSTEHDQPTYREALQMINAPGHARNGRGWGLPVGVRNSGVLLN